MSARIMNNDMAVFANDTVVWWEAFGARAGAFVDPVRVDGSLLTNFPEIYLHWPEVEKRNTYTLSSSGTLIRIENSQAIVRIDDDTVVNKGVSEEGRGITQFSKINEQIHAIRDTGVPVEVVSAGTLDGGRRAYCTMEIGNPIDVAGYSKIEKFFTIADAHDGTSVAKGVSTAGAVVCNNTFQAYVIGAPKAWAIGHTRNAEAYLDDAVKAFTEALEQQFLIDEAVERLLNETYYESQFQRELLPQLIGTRPEEEGRARTNWIKTHDLMTDRYWGDDLAGGARSTKWGALMAVQGYEQHEQPVRGKTSSAQARHLDRLFFGNQPLTTKAAQILVDA